MAFVSKLMLKMRKGCHKNAKQRRCMSSAPPGHGAGKPHSDSERLAGMNCQMASVRSLTCRCRRHAPKQRLNYFAWFDGVLVYGQTISNCNLHRFLRKVFAIMMQRQTDSQINCFPSGVHFKVQTHWLNMSIRVPLNASIGLVDRYPNVRIELDDAIGVRTHQKNTDAGRAWLGDVWLDWLGWPVWWLDIRKLH